MKISELVRRSFLEGFATTAPPGAYVCFVNAVDDEDFAEVGVLADGLRLGQRTRLIAYAPGNRELPLTRSEAYDRGVRSGARLAAAAAK